MLLMMLHDYDIILVMSQYSKLSHLENRTRISYPCRPFKHTIVECCVKKSAHSAQNSGRKACGVTLPPSENCK